MKTCTIPPNGWHCTRDAGHNGPCAALPDGYEVTHITDQIDKLGARYRNLLALLNSLGVDSDTWELAKPLLDEIYEDGRKIGVTFDKNPTLRVRFEKLPPPVEPKPAEPTAELTSADEEWRPETAWMIETNIDGRPHWLGPDGEIVPGKPLRPRLGFIFTDDPNKAIRFAEEQDAFAVGQRVDVCSPVVWTPTEHQWF
jgi:hypothetical protein